MTKYFAFISYKRGGLDEQVANWIHSKLEKYPYPVDIVSPKNRPEHESLIRRIYIDTKELPAKESDFSDDIKEALENSRYLIVVCSKRAAKSAYINNEVLYFLETHNEDSNKILPVFIDTVDNGLPSALSYNEILIRHCPIYNSFLDAKNEINLYCFYHIVAFLLKIDFRVIYDRYKRYSLNKERKRIWTRNGIYVLLLMLILFMGHSMYSRNQLVNKQSRIVNLEKEVFPYSVVRGYVENFMAPVIDYLKNKEPNAHIYVHMPTRSEDLDHNHKDRFDIISNYVAVQLSLDSIKQVRLETRMPRGSMVHKLYAQSNELLNHKYLDFASTTSTFLAIAQKKKEYPEYRDVKVDDMIEEYTNIFIRQTKDELGADTVYVTFVTKISDILEEINK